MDGVLILDKPIGLTSHDVVAALRRLTGQKKAGHTGTLDPLATGVLVVCFGAATKALPYLPEGSKTYRVEACLGIATDTQDRTGRVIKEDPHLAVTYGELREALAGFLGRSAQIPPMYSAVQINGERLYHLARAGREIPRPPREIEIRTIVMDWPDPISHPVFTYGDRFGFTVTGSRGFYVRTLCDDLGRKLGCGAHLFNLRRLASGPFTLDDALPLDGLTRETAAERLWPIGRALGHLPALELDPSEARRICHGNSIAACRESGGEGLFRAVTPSGDTIAVLERRGDFWQPLRVF